MQGCITQVVPRGEDVLSACRTLAEKFLEIPAAGLATIKKSLWAAEGAQLVRADRRDARLYRQCLGSSEAQAKHEEICQGKELVTGSIRAETAQRNRQMNTVTGLRTIPTFIDFHAATRPDVRAVTTESNAGVVQSLTWSELQALVNRAGNWLMQRGLRKGRFHRPAHSQQSGVLHSVAGGLPKRRGFGARRSAIFDSRAALHHRSCRRPHGGYAGRDIGFGQCRLRRLR